LQNPTITNATAAASGTYAVTVTVEGCTSPAGTVSVTVNPVPAVPTISGTNVICPNATTTLTSSAASGNQWYKGTEPISGATGQTLTVTQAGSYWVEVRNANGCTAASTAFVVTRTTLSAPTISGNLSFCEGSSTVLTSSAATDNQWYKGPDLIIGATGQTFTAATAGEYKVEVTLNGCTAMSAVATVVEKAVPAVPTASSNGPICAGAALDCVLYRRTMVRIAGRVRMVLPPAART
jgi:hypothetical protein